MVRIDVENWVENNLEDPLDLLEEDISLYLNLHSELHGPIYSQMSLPHPSIAEYFEVVKDSSILP